jgi:hypothetical protein
VLASFGLDKDVPEVYVCMLKAVGGEDGDRKIRQVEVNQIMNVISKMDYYMRQ